ncbi:MAG: quinolinate synthase NadA [Lachnospiraceae bacterium]
MNIKDMQEKIINLKKENDICILAHSYQRREITEIADYTGDSYALAKLAAKVSNKTIIMCGVRFMAETVKILSQDKKVILANPSAGCPMAEQMDKELICQMKEYKDGYAVVAYINTTSNLKTICDVCVTSSSALKIVSAMPQKDILFIPDINLGTYIKNQIPDKNIKLVHGGCPTHARVTVKEVNKAKQAHPDALLLVHPECVPEVAAMADYIGSTSGIMDYAKKSSAREFIIGTENSIVEHLQLDCPEKRFYPLSKDLICHNMKATTLSDVLLSCEGQGGEEIIMDEEERLAAKKCIDKMIEYGG